VRLDYVRRFASLFGSRFGAVGLRLRLPLDDTAQLDALDLIVRERGAAEPGRQVEDGGVDACRLQDAVRNVVVAAVDDAAIVDIDGIVESQS